MSTKDEVRKKIEEMVVESFGANVSLCNATHEIFQNIAGDVPFLIVRGGEERRIVDNFALIGNMWKKEVYEWSIADGLYRCTPCAELINHRISEKVSLSDEQRRAAQCAGFSLFNYYLKNIWQHPVLGANTDQNPTSHKNSESITVDNCRGSVFILKDGHLSLNDAPSIRSLKELIETILWRQGDRLINNSNQDNSLKGMCIVLTVPLGWNVPEELKSHAVEIIFPAPNKDELRSLFYGSILGSNYKNSPLYPSFKAQEAKVLHAATGLKASSFVNGLKVSAVEQSVINNNKTHEIIEDILVKAKRQAIKAGGAINYEEPNWSMDDVGGHDRLKEYLRQRSMFFDPENPITDLLPEGVSLPLPKGILMVGIPGAGKSLQAKAMASMLNIPLLTLDMGAVFTKTVGGSEERIRTSLQLAEECAPCVLRIEEIEKALSGSGSSDQSDGGTTNRVFQTILNWLQEKTAPVFVVATANAVEQLPPELLRKGRFDNIFFVDLPVKSEREEIFRIHLRKAIGLTDEQIDDTMNLSRLAERTENFSGAEIESLIKDSLYKAVSYFNDNKQLSEFRFTEDFIHDTIGPNNSRTYRILYDSEKEKLEALRSKSKESWENASSFEYENEVVAVSNNVSFIDAINNYNNNFYNNL